MIERVGCSWQSEDRQSRVETTLTRRHSMTRTVTTSANATPGLRLRQDRSARWLLGNDRSRWQPSGANQRMARLRSVH